MSRTLCRVVGVVAVWLTMVSVSISQAATTLSLPDDAHGDPGAVVQVPITAATANGVFGIDMTVQYDPAVVEAQNVTTSGIAASAGFAIIRNLNTPGTIVISLYGVQDPLAGSGEIARIQFHVLGARGTSCPLTITSVVINEGHIAAVIDNGLFTVPTLGALLSMPDTAQGSPGAIVQVPISVTPGDGIFGMDMTLHYDPAVLEAQNVTVSGIAATAGFSLVKNLNTPGTIIIIMFAPGDPLAGSGAIAQIQFHVLGAAGTSSPLTFQSATINEGAIPATFDNGLFTVPQVGAVLSMPDTAQGGPGAVVQVPISVTPGDGILGVDTTITYDPAVLQAQNVTVSGIGSTAGFAVIRNMNTPGVIVITTYATGDLLSGSGEFLRIQFLVLGSPGTSSNLSFTSASINEGQIPATTDNGLFTVTCAGAANGTSCTDGDAVCTTGDTCQAGVCVGTPLSCDDSNPCTVDSCTPGLGCQQTPGNSGAVCRASAGACDLAESCTGTSATCPADFLQPSGTSCTDDGNACTADQCNGSSTSCQHPAGNAGAVCRASTGTCDVAETCTGASTTCPADAFATAVTTCTGTSNGGACDGVDHCSGTAATCVDVFQASGFTCRPAAAGGCDVAEVCGGSTGACPADGFAIAATLCTGSSQTGVCDSDAADHCSGAANTCVDVFRGSETTCRSAVNGCDVAEVCSGTSGACTAPDAFATAAVTCGFGTSNGGACDGVDHCSGTAATCVDVFQASGFTCRPAAAGGCDVAEVCGGSTGSCPADGFANAATLCTGSSQTGVCDSDAADHCSGTANTCVDVFRGSETTCRSAVNGCDVAEVCSGTSGACTAPNVFATAAVTCGFGTSNGGACDGVDHCSGTAATCVDVFQASGFTCRPAAAGGCDVAEVCGGSTGSCPADGFASAATLCTGSSQTGVCDSDASDHCSGTANTCVDVFRGSETTCRSAVNGCDVAEVCSGTSGACTAPNVFASSAVTCGFGTSNGGACDGVDHCSGTAATCVDVFQASGFTCRSAAGGGCDVAEVCGGSTGSCPADGFATAATLCTGSSQTGVCDSDASDHCSGTANTCVDVFRGSETTCRSAVNACDVAEVCSGSSGACTAPDVFASSAVTCGFGTSNGGACDGVDHCSGTAATCVDVFQASGFTCRPAAAGGCDVAEVCGGSTGACPVDGFASAATLCTGSSQTGVCDSDASDHCSGTANTCVDVFRGSETTCRSAVNGCDVAEVCSGTSGACTAPNVFATAAVTCGFGTSNGGACDGVDHCSGTAATCVDVFQASGFTCRPAAAGGCDVAEVCGGSTGSCPVDGFASAATLCTGSSQTGVCDSDAADHCSGTANTCVDVFRGSETTCRSAVNGCDVAEVCSGTSGACTAPNVFATAAVTCGFGTSNGGACDGVDHCSGTAATCVDVFQASGFTCRPAAAGGCDVAEVCGGSTGSCPADGFASAATLCAGSSQTGVCDSDAADHCSGTANTCVDVFRGSETTCRSAVNACDVAEVCSGTSGACTAPNVFASSAVACGFGTSNGDSCDNDGADHCSGTAATCVDVFQPGGQVCRADAGQCDVAESCTGTSGACPPNAFEPNGTSCNDADPATCTDACSAGSCAGTPVAEPLALNSSLSIGKTAGVAQISWSDPPGPYNVYRGTNGPGAAWAYDQTCLVHATTSTTIADSDIPPVGTLYYYVISRVNACRESVLGTDSSGAPIPNNNPCANAPTDTDNDGTADVVDNCPFVANPGQADVDADNHGDVCDNCPTSENPDQQDSDFDSIGNVCDSTPFPFSAALIRLRRIGPAGAYDDFWLG